LISQAKNSISIWLFVSINLKDLTSIKNYLPEIIRRLSLDQNNWDKMPRSRDFPINGAKLIQQWQKEGMQE
jgi:hypothetical protein